MRRYARIFLIVLLLPMLEAFADEPLLRFLKSAELTLSELRISCYDFDIQHAGVLFVKLNLTLDSIQNLQNKGAQYLEHQDRIHRIRKEADALIVQLQNTSIQLRSSSVELIAESQPEKSNEVGEESLESSQRLADMSMEISLLRTDTAELNEEIKRLKKDKSKLNNELERHQRGVFLGLGFGYNYFINGPRTYYVKPDSTIGRYGKTSGMSFMFSGFVAYKITDRHSIIFNMPLGDITNREDYRVGLFNKRIAGGLGYGYNMGNISIVGIVNVSPYEEIEYDLIRDQQVNEEAYTPVNHSGYPTSTFYSPSFTIGFSYNFLAPEKFWMNSF